MLSKEGSAGGCCNASWDDELAAEQKSMLRDLMAQVANLVDDHHALCDCLCAAGVLTPGEIDLQRQLHRKATKLHGVCASPVLVERIAIFTAMGSFASTSSAAAAAVRATLPVGRGRAAEAMEVGGSASSSVGDAALDLAPAAVAEPAPRVGFSLFRRFFMSEPPSAEASAEAGRQASGGTVNALDQVEEVLCAGEPLHPGTTAHEPHDETLNSMADMADLAASSGACALPVCHDLAGMDQAPQARAATDADADSEASGADPAAGAASSPVASVDLPGQVCDPEPGVLDTSSLPTSGTSSRFFGGLFYSGQTSAVTQGIEADESCRLAEAGPPADPPTGLPSEQSAPPPQCAQHSEPAPGAGDEDTGASGAAPAPPPSDGRPGEDGGPPTGAAPATDSAAKDVVQRRGGPARFFGRLLGYGPSAEGGPPVPGYPLMQVEDILRTISRMAGWTAASQLSETSKATSRSLRGLLPELYQEAPIIYICGGSCGIAMEPTERFDLATGTWEALPSMHMPRRACAAASLGGRVYMMGGVDVPRFNASTFRESLQLKTYYEDKDQPECFDPSTNRWELLPPLHRPFTHAAAAAIGGRLYVFGGLSFGGVLDQAQCYDPARQRWECLQPMPTPRFECAAVPLRGKLYVLGGANVQGEPLAVVECYEPRLGTWKVLQPMSQARYGCAAAAALGRLHVFGGHGAWEDLSDAEGYDPEVGFWSAMRPMSARRNHCGAATAQGRIYIFGGHADGRDILTVDCFDPANDTYEVVALMPQPRGHCLAVAVQP